MSNSIGKKLTENLVKVTVNDFGDYIILYPDDASFRLRYTELLKWIEERQKELGNLAEEKDKQYEGRQIITYDEDGNSEIDVEQLCDLVEIQTKFFRECEEQINALFGQDTLKKYLRVIYEVNPEFIPDEDCITDFLEEITPVLNSVYNTKFERAKGRYNKNRKGKNSKVVPINE